mmetsp:Transcript_12530/g.24741  ORF Transcript_12530/g.24741 Transcript_12530/m.24741 type:complete len:263 (-) Transcript_12530:2108-2896(-)
MLLDGAQNHARLFGEEFEGAVDGEIVSWAVHEWVVGEGRGALKALLVDFEAEKLEHLSHGGSGVHAQALEEKNLQRNDLRELKVCGDVLQPAAAHALGPGLEAALLARAQPTDQRHVPAPAPTPSLRVEPPLELGPKRADWVSHEEHDSGGPVVVHVLRRERVRLPRQHLMRPHALPRQHRHERDVVVDRPREVPGSILQQQPTPRVAASRETRKHGARRVLLVHLLLPLFLLSLALHRPTTTTAILQNRPLLPLEPRLPLG